MRSKTPLEQCFIDLVKLAALGSTVTAGSKQVGKFNGFATANALKAPGASASAQAINPRRSITNAISAFKA